MVSSSGVREEEEAAVVSLGYRLLTSFCVITVVAQQIPEEFDGIVAGAPAINWAKFMIQEAWGYIMASAYGICDQTCPTRRRRLRRREADALL